MPKENIGPDCAEKPSREKLYASSQAESRGALDFQDEAVGLPKSLVHLQLSAPGSKLPQQFPNVSSSLLVSICGFRHWINMRVEK